MKNKTEIIAEKIALEIKYSGISVEDGNFQEDLLKSIDLRKIKNIIPEEDERACLITFKRIQGVEPWLEICDVPNKGQHVHLEIEISGEPDFEFDSFVTTSNKARAVKEITKEIDKAYERKRK